VTDDATPTSVALSAANNDIFYRRTFLGKCFLKMKCKYPCLMFFHQGLFEAALTSNLMLSTVHQSFSVLVLQIISTSNDFLLQQNSFSMPRMDFGGPW